MNFKNRYTDYKIWAVIDISLTSFFFTGLDILPHISKSRPNLVENHLSLILHCLLKCDLPNVLVRVIVDTEEMSLSVSSTVLLGELLHLANLLLPREVSVN